MFHFCYWYSTDLHSIICLWVTNLLSILTTYYAFCLCLLGYLPIHYVYWTHRVYLSYLFLVSAADWRLSVKTANTHHMCYHRLTICPGFPRETWCPAVIPKSILFHSQKCPDLVDNVYIHLSINYHLLLVELCKLR